ncbi:DUF2264 domain-containing protein [Glycomyces sp. TRM65418]|uniref:DUF2264 domain-containing protein n=1 Tax=Glycomyces sp. TRM65418 TaxID=2867006 RepID=UPI001CE5A6E6|nr:DUF2264 domain-containing protein [Glycomyces sp. TRM65418]MCC3764496.1 DUF2264 domain-containing protein [Glycomyces sp. TRM65418]QZD54167.1 DUF2264 domain-containing protein [Glycomyces sp. TRM65418]
MPTPTQQFGPLGPTRDGWAQAAIALCAPAIRSAARGPERQPVTMSNHDRNASWFECLVRPLWGLAAAAAGGFGAPELWTDVRNALAAATDPSHSWYVGDPGRGSPQILVESASVGFAVAAAREQLWEPLTGPERDRLAAWLAKAYRGSPFDNNWRFFPILAGLGLDAAGIDRDRSIERAHLDRLAEFAIGNGWYTDGPGGRVDYYNPFGFHFYGPLLAHLTGDERFLPAASRFAAQFAEWFGQDGASVPYGRSLGYRFAAGSFWGALPLADAAPLPWAEIRGLAQRHLAWWWDRPILDESGRLTVGYGYANSAHVEHYISAGSPYWAMKCFLPLMTELDHPFWTSEPDAPERGSVTVHSQPHALAVMSRDEHGDVVRLNAQSEPTWAKGGRAAYAKFAYSSLAAFSQPTVGSGLEFAAPDSSLVFSLDGRDWHGRADSADGTIDGDTASMEWSPLPGVDIETELVAHGGWHLRLHRIRCATAVHIGEGGWCVPWGDDGSDEAASETEAWAKSGGVESRILELHGNRAPAVIRPVPGTHLLWPRSILPVLTGVLAPGEHRLACAAAVGRGPICPFPQELRARFDDW